MPARLFDDYLDEIGLCRRLSTPQGVRQPGDCGQLFGRDAVGVGELAEIRRGRRHADRLDADGWQFAVCTNKRAPLANKLLDALNLSRRFKVIAGPDTYGMAKPDPAHLLRTIEAAGGDAGRAIMVGDSRTDVDTARAATVPVIGVDFGYTDTPMAEIAPDAVISHYDALIGAVDRLGAGWK